MRGHPNHARYRLWSKLVRYGETLPQNLTVGAPANLERKVAIIDHRYIESLIYHQRISPTAENLVLHEVFLPPFVVGIIDQCSAHLFGRRCKTRLDRKFDARALFAAV